MPTVSVSTLPLSCRLYVRENQAKGKKKNQSIKRCFDYNMPIVGILKVVATPDRQLDPVNQYIVTVVIGFSQIASIFWQHSSVNRSPESSEIPNDCCFGRTRGLTCPSMMWPIHLFFGFEPSQPPSQTRHTELNQ